MYPEKRQALIQTSGALAIPAQDLVRLLHLRKLCFSCLISVCRVDFRPFRRRHTFVGRSSAVRRRSTRQESTPHVKNQHLHQFNLVGFVDAVVRRDIRAAQSANASELTVIQALFSTPSCYTSNTPTCNTPSCKRLLPVTLPNAFIKSSILASSPHNRLICWPAFGLWLTFFP
jgi:hypothetical protein